MAQRASRLVTVLSSLPLLLAWMGGQPARAALPAADPERLSSITRTLAAPSFEGREPGTAGEKKTLDLLIGEFRSLGLRPAAPGGSWTQKVELLKTRIANAPSARLSGRGGTLTLDCPTDIYLTTSRDAPRAIIDAPLVFVGYGAAAPERGWDDFKSVDLTGKVAVFLVNDPDFEAAPTDDAYGRFGGNAMTVYGRWAHKFEVAGRRGAVAALVIHETRAAGYGWNVVTAPAGVNYVIRGDSSPRTILNGWIREEAAAKVFALAGMDFAAARRGATSASFRPIDLPLRLSIDAQVSTEYLVSHNVLGRIAGSKAPDEAIVFGAHWDALGMKNGVANPGAHDNALGVAAILELARLFTREARPRRSLIFAAWTAEERGLLGAEYYAAHPSIPLDKTVANLTFDVLQTAGPARNSVLIGRGQSDLGDLAEAAAQAQGRTVADERYPERGLFYRSDHFAFAKRGVPAILSMALGGGIDLERGGLEAGDAWLGDYTRRCYHQPCDIWDAGWDLRGAAQEVDLFYRMGRLLADGGAWPAWKAGSEFHQARPGAKEDK